MKLIHPKGWLAFISTLLLAFCGLVSLAPVAHASAVVTTPHVRAELMAHAPQGWQAGQTVWLGVALQPQAGWHTYWKNPGDSGLPTELRWTLPKGWQAGPVLWPTPEVLPLGDSLNYGYDHPVLLRAQLQVTPNTAMPTVQVKANWLVCKTECIPESATLSLPLPLSGAITEHAASFEAAQAAQAQTRPEVQAQAVLRGPNLALRLSGLPASWRGQALWVLPETPEILSTQLPQGAAAPTWSNEGVWQVLWPLSPLREQSPQRLRWLVRLQSSPQGSLSVEAPVQGSWPTESTPAAPFEPPPESTLSWGVLLGALVGGLVLNLMPCVFPVLAIKLLSLLKFQPTGQVTWGHSLRAQCLAYSLGVVASFMALGGLMLLLRTGGAQLGWGFQLQSPGVVAFLIVLFTTMALNLAGVYEWRGAWLGDLTQVNWRHPLVNSVFSGVLAVLIASPCTAPFMGASLGLTLTLPTLSALTVFLALGLGMALPYLLLGLLPQVAPWWVRHLPKPGAWMQTFKQAMAFPLLATVIWLLWVLGQQVGLEGMVVLMGGLLALSGVLWAWGLSSGNSPWLRRCLLVAFLALGGVLVGAWGDLVVHPMVNTASSNPTNPEGQAPDWQVWRPGLPESLAAQGQPVFVDFTAAWCVTCQFNKHATLADARLLRDMAQHKVALLRADWTRQDPDITQALRRLGRSGVPVYVVHLPGQAPVVLPELLTIDAVRAALHLESH